MNAESRPPAESGIDNGAGSHVATRISGTPRIPYVPVIDPGGTTMAAAFAYINAGLYVGPLEHGTKNPGALLGKGWPSKTSTDPQVIDSWFNGTDLGLFLHAGRSGLVILDVDDPDKVPAEFWPALDAMPYQATRATGDTRRGHYLALLPAGRLIGNSVGKDRLGWGEIRGTNGVIVLAPTRHEKAADGGVYTWRRTGAIPLLPDVIGATLPDGDPALGAATGRAVAAFMAAHVGNNKPWLLEAVMRRFADEVARGNARHDAAVSAACQIARESAAELYPARTAFAELQSAFEAVTVGERRTDWPGITAWAIGQLTPERIAQVAARHYLPAEDPVIERVDDDEFDCAGEPDPFDESAAAPEVDSADPTLVAREARIAKRLEAIEIEVEAKRRAKKAAKKAAKTAPADPARFFDINGLLVETLAREVMGADHFAYGIDGQFWRHHDGVWVPAQHEIAHRATRLLGERHRNSHVTNVEGKIEAWVPRLSAEPVEQYINFRNGLLDWRTGELLSHDPKVLSTTQLGTEWNPDAKCPAVDKFLAAVVAPDVVETMWEVIGYLMYSGNPLHKAFLLLGPGGNGKSTFIHMIQALLNPANCSAVTLNDLNDNRFAASELLGKLANLAGDIEGTFQKETARFKAVTAGDRIPGERKNANRFMFTPWCSFVFSANRIPGSADTTPGYLRRWVPIRFDSRFAVPDIHVGERITTPDELAGVAARAVPALRRLLARRMFESTPTMDETMDHFARRIDQVAQWIEDRCELVPDHFTDRATAYASYKLWSSGEGHAGMTTATLYERLGMLPGVRETKRQGNRGFVGFKVVTGRMLEHYAAPALSDFSDNERN
jgi:P4 family phage/plasmid primase-like protien